MMKYLVLSVGLVLAVTFETAAHGGGGGGRGVIEDGLAVGFEYGAQGSRGNFSKGDNPDHYMREYVGYSMRLLDGDLFFRAEADLTTWFAESGPNGNDLYLNIEVEYDRMLDGNTTLSLLLQHEWDDIRLTRRFDDRSNHHAMIAPGARLTRTYNNGDAIFTEVRIPVEYSGKGVESSLSALQSHRDRNHQNNVVGFNFTLGWESSFGLIAEATLLSTITPRTQYNAQGRAQFVDGWRVNSGITNLELAFEYEYDRYHLALDIDIPVGLNARAGMEITPTLSVNVGPLDIYGEWVFGHVRPGWSDNLEQKIGLGIRWTILDFAH